MIRSYKDLDVWKRSVELVKSIYLITKSFPKDEIYGLVNQMRRCAISISSNIAEGAGRNSNKDFIRFLSIAIGSSFELESQLIISEKLKFISSDDLVKIVNHIHQIQNMIYKLQESIQEKILIT